MRLLHDRILIKPTPPDKVRGGIELFGTDVEDKNEGTVVEIGEGVPLHNIHLNVTGEVTNEAMNTLKEVVELIERGRAMKVAPGDLVVYGRYAGTKVNFEGEPHIIIREADIFCVL